MKQMRVKQMRSDREVQSDQALCREAIRQGSKSFYTASKLLPEHVRQPAFALYAFCRLADDWVDEGPTTIECIDQLQARLDDIYAGAPADHHVDRAFADIVHRFELPKCLPDALIDGFRWDVEGRVYHTIDDLLDYAARVASTVGAMMTVLMGERRRPVLARAADLGLAMQLTNIARDVGEDARNGRLYLPRDWLLEEGVDPDQWLTKPIFDKRIERVTKRLIDKADHYYRKAAPGIANLPLSCRPAIKAASMIYREIGRKLVNDGCNSIDRRTVVPKSRKISLLTEALVTTPLIRRSAGKLDERATDFLANWSPIDERSNKLDRGLQVIGLMQQRDRERRARQRGLVTG